MSLLARSIVESSLRGAPLLMLASCVMRETAIDVHVDDPSAVTVRSMGTGDGVLPAGAAPQKVSLARGDVATGTYTGAAYELDGVRDADRSIRLEWDTHLPLRLGERVTLFPPSGDLLVAAPEEPLPISWGVATGTFRVSLCARLTPRSNHGNVSYDASVTATTSCRPLAGTASVPIALDATGDHARIWRHDRPDRSLAGFLLALDLVVFGAVGTPMLVTGEAANSKPLVATGASVLAVGAAFALLLTPTLVASAHDEALAPSVR